MRIYLIAILLALASCNGLRRQTHRFEVFHDQHDSLAAMYCAKWYPTTSDSSRKVKVLPGKILRIPGKTVYANCDSAYRAALAKAKHDGSDVVVVPSVKVKSQDSYRQRDTVQIHDEVVTVDNKQLIALAYQKNQEIAAKNAEIERLNIQAVTFKTKMMTYRKTTFTLLGLLVLAIAGTILELKYKLSTKVKRLV